MRSRHRDDGSYHPRHDFYAGADQDWYELVQQERAEEPPPRWDRTTTTALRVSKAGTRRVYARQQLRTIHLGYLALFTLCLALGPSSEHAQAHPQIARAMAAAVTAVGCLFGVLLMRRAIVIDGDRITVRNLLWRRSVTAADVLRFEPPAPYGRLLHTGLRIVLADGRILWANVFSGTPLNRGPLDLPECDELNAWLDDVRAGVVLPVPVRLPHSRRFTRLWRSWLVFLVLFIGLVLYGCVVQIIHPT